MTNTAHPAQTAHRAGAASAGGTRPPPAPPTDTHRQGNMEKKLSTVEDDFESLLEEEEVNTKTENKSLSFNDLFEAISEESEDSLEHIIGDNQAGNVEEDFEALLSGESDTEVNISKQSTEETLNSEGKGFSQIFISDSSPQVIPDLGHVDPGHVDPGHGEHGDRHCESGHEQLQVLITKKYFCLSFILFFRKQRLKVLRKRSEL